MGAQPKNDLQDLIYVISSRLNLCNNGYSLPLPGGGGFQGGDPLMDQGSIDYFRTRQRVEREAAKAAANEAARRTHLELAEGYAALARKG